VSGINGQLSPHVVRCLSGQSDWFRTSPPRLSNLGRQGREGPFNLHSISFYFRERMQPNLLNLRHGRLIAPL
jgi:hypothetical protein